MKKTKELAYGPRPTLHYEDLKNISGKLNGYTDMVIHDTSLDESMRTLTKDINFLKNIKDKLSPVSKQFMILQLLQT